ncbi:MAG: SMC-Scp complex subunit ScpB [Phycisphaerales bacterium]|nr:MAG: SMC-Scp complex subunit ScpB [Phycisphaerales bacterium]
MTEERQEQSNAEHQTSNAENVLPEEKQTEQAREDADSTCTVEVEEDLLDSETELGDEAEEVSACVEGDAEIDLYEEQEATIESVVEAVLFASDEPLSEARLAGIVDLSAKQMRQHIETLNEKYRAGGNAFRIEQIAGGYQMLTLSQYNHWLRKLHRARSDSKLSPAALETLAIIAYKQPVIRADIEAIRGVAAGEMIRGLMYKGLVKIVGRAEVLGRPMLYGTTRKFLEVFGLNSLKDLPKIEELKKPPS